MSGNRRLRVLMFDPTNRAPLYNAYLVDALEKVDEVDVVMPPRREETEVPAGAAISRRRVFPRGSAPTSRTRSLALYARAWAYVLRHAASYDVVHIQWLPLLEKSPVELVLIRHLLRTNGALVYTAHNAIPMQHEKASRALWRHLSVLYTMIPRVIVHSEWGKSVLLEQFAIPEELISVIAHGPLLHDYNAVAEQSRPAMGTRCVGMVGAINRYKGAEDAIAGFALAAEHIGHDLLLSGRAAADYEEELRSLASQLGIADRVHIRNRYLTTEEVVDAYSRLDVALFPYRRITQSGAALTAIALGVPILAYDVGGLGELVRHNRVGRVVAPGDRGAFAAALVDMVRSPLDDYIRECRRLVQAWSWASIANATLGVYESLLARVS